MQQLKTLFDEVKEEFHTQDAKLDGKIESLITLHKERLAFEKEMQRECLALQKAKLNFEREKAGLAPLPFESGK